MIKNKLILGFVDIIGNSISKKIHGVVDVVNDYPTTINLYTGNLRNNMEEIITDDSEFSNYKPQPFLGVLIEDVDGKKFPVPNVKVTFIKDIIVSDTKENNTQITNYDYSGNTRIVDYCITNSNGEYFGFVEDGIYTIKIEGGRYNQIFHNQEISGLKNQYYFKINSLIERRYGDTLVLHGTDMRLIKGTMYDQNKKPIPNAEIIISNNNEVFVYHKTDKYGNYVFGLPLGEYDVRIRSPYHSVKIAKNIKFEDCKDFMESLNLQSILFRRG